MRREGARNHLRHRFDELGGIAVFTTMVGNNNHRPLDRAEFRGFTLADRYAPLIFVNAYDDTLSGQIFTFLHEYAHVTRGESGVGDDDYDARETMDVERWCNAVAAEVLVPSDDLRAQFDPSAGLVEQLEKLGNRYSASTLTVLVRLRDGGIVPREGFDGWIAAERRRAQEILATRPARHGGDHYLNQPFRLGEAFSRAVLSDVRRGGTSYTEAQRLLNMRSANQLARYAETLGLG